LRASYAMHPIECILRTPPNNDPRIHSVPDREPTIRSRELGEGLRAAMEAAGLTGKEMATLLNWSPSWVSRLLTGRRSCTAADAGSFLGACRVTGEERERLLNLVDDQSTPGWLQQHGSNLPKQLVTLIDHENKATAIYDCQPLIVPGMLQIDEYAHAVISSDPNIPPGEIRDRVAARLARHTLFTSDQRPEFTFYIHEFALRTPVASPEVMSEQLHHLLRMSVRSYITLRVVPVGVGAHVTMGGAFKLMEFTDFKPVVYLESRTSCLFLERVEEIEAYHNVLTALAECTLTEGQSRDLIASYATELHEEPDDH
jgi:transcriptional regulator with XRE-family HTH domain